MSGAAGGSSAPKHGFDFFGAGHVHEYSDWGRLKGLVESARLC
jgi:hypothetical protein